MGLLSRPFAAMYYRRISGGQSLWIAEARNALMTDLSGPPLQVSAGAGPPSPLRAWRHRRRPDPSPHLSAAPATRS